LVGNLDCHKYLYVFGALNMVSGRLTTRLVERPRPTKKGTPSKRRHLQQAFARQLRDIARLYPAAQYPCVVRVIDRAPWHKGVRIDAVLAACPHLALDPLPRYSPQLQVIERLWKGLRRRATHNRLFPTIALLKHALRRSLSYYQTLKARVLTLIPSARKRTKSSTA
jgi:DDE superfamily endonuclease